MDEAPRAPGAARGASGGGPRRVLLVSHSLSGGGAERFAATLATALDRRRFAPQVCVAVDRVTYTVPEDVPVTALGYRGPRDLPRSMLALRRLVRRQRPHVVLSNVLSTNCLTGGALLGLEGRPPWVARVANAPGISEPRVQQWWARRVYPRARFLVSNSAAMEAAVAARYGGAGERCRSIPNPTDFRRIDELATETPPHTVPAAAALLISVGRLHRQKRLDLLLQAVAAVRRRWDVHLWICGEGEDRGRVEAWVRELGLGRSVTLLGFCQNPFALMRQADLFVLTSDFEGLPNALIEAQGLGLPAVATRCPFGPEEIVEDGVTGRLVSTGDAAAVAEAILGILGDDRERRHMGAAAAARARRLYDLPRIIPQWEDLLTAAMEPAVAGDAPVQAERRPEA